MRLFAMIFFVVVLVFIAVLAGCGDQPMPVASAPEAGPAAKELACPETGAPLVDGVWYIADAAGSVSSASPYWSTYPMTSMSIAEGTVNLREPGIHRYQVSTIDVNHPFIDRKYRLSIVALRSMWTRNVFHSMDPDNPDALAHPVFLALEAWQTGWNRRGEQTEEWFVGQCADGAWAFSQYAGEPSPLSCDHPIRLYEDDGEIFIEGNMPGMQVTFHPSWPQELSLSGELTTAPVEPAFSQFVLLK